MGAAAAAAAAEATAAAAAAGVASAAAAVAVAAAAVVVAAAAAVAATMAGADCICGHHGHRSINSRGGECCGCLGRQCTTSESGQQSLKNQFPTTVTTENHTISSAIFK